MSCFCCQNIYDLGCIAHCDTLVFPFNAGTDGEFILDTDFNGRLFKFRQNQTIGQPVVFNPPLNENFRYKTRLYSPDGALVTYTETDGAGNDVVYDCFTFRTQYSADITFEDLAP